MEPTANVPYLTDGRRVREFRRYYQSKHTRYVQSIAGARHDVTDASPVPPPSEADYTLSAIAKCVVHSIDVDKVMISLLDDKTQYFLGGATKETSSVVLGDEDPSLWFGCHSVGIRGGICEVACSVTPDYRHYPFYVVPDIKDVPQWRDVVGDYRFYVGIPIKTRAGDNIGTLFGFSTRPRPDLAPEEKLVMERMASAVMNHLELELSVLERSRVLRMNRSLADFASNKTVPSTPVAPPLSSSLPGFSDAPFSVPSPFAPELDSLYSPPPFDATPTILSPRPDWRDNAPAPFSVASPSSVLSPTRLDYGGARNKVTEPERPVLMPHSSVYRRAAELLRFGLDCSGVIFVTMDAGSVANPDRSHVTILGGAVTQNNRIPCDFKADALWDAIKYYPGGHLFHFDNSGRPWAIAEQEEPPSSFFTNPSPVTLDRVLDNHEDEPYVQTVAGSLRSAIPSAQQMLIAPLRSVREGVVSAAIAWRDDWHSIFSSAVELPFMNCFCISVFATMLHEDALTANKHKADFLANVSHELRSPLHGVLASVDLLQDTRRSRTQQVLIEDIQNCGRVLLNTIDQLLDLSDLSQAERAGDDASGDPEAMEITASSRTKSQRLVQPIHADLASLCEDAVHSVLLSQSFHGAVETMSKGARHDLTTLSKASRRKPVISVDIMCRDWHFMIQPGAVQRVIMNLLGNAVKYTKTGFIHLQLAAREVAPGTPSGRLDPEARTVAVLTISDSGCGISPAFLQTHLWTSFAQENHNVSGSGLGLSITRRIITMLGGTIDVRSTVDAGTMVVVELPLHKPPDSTDVFDDDDDAESPRAADEFYSRFKKVRQKTEGRTVGLFLRTNLGDADSLSQSQGVAYAHQSVVRCLETWFGLRVLVTPPPGTTLDFAMVDEELVNTADVGRSLPCIILTDGASSRESRRSPGDLSHSAWVRRPAAPGRLERAFTEIIDSQSGHGQNYREDDGPGGHIESMMRAYEDTRRRSSMSRTISHTGTIDSQNSGQEPPKSDGSPWSEAGTSPHTAPSTATPAISPPEPPSPRILVVDDNAINLKVLSRLLAKLNVSSKHIVMASNGLEAVAKYATSIQHDILAENAELREMGALPQPKAPPAATAAAGAGAAAGQKHVPVPFDIVLMDLNMPVMDGFDATREIRALELTKPALRPCMIAALTGLIGARERERAFNAGVDVFCTKPFTREEIRVLLKDWRRRVSDDFVMN